jgi:hypothetical protein
MNDIETTTTEHATARPVMHWVTVRDTSGRPHLEMRWSTSGSQLPLAHAA